MTTPAQNKAVHAALNRLGIDDGLYRAMLREQFGKASSRDLSDEEARRFLDALNAKGGGRPKTAVADGPFAPILRALWIAGHNLALIDNRDDRALIAFIERQTGLAHPRFLQDAREAAKAIEALKAWLARGGVEWPAKSTPALLKQAVLAAIARRLETLGEPVVFGAHYDELTAQQLDERANALGAQLRAAAKRKTKPEGRVMVAYSFKAQFAEPILGGTKRQTIRANRKRHARPGELMQLYTGMRTRNYRLLMNPRCVAVFPVVIQPDCAFVGAGYPGPAHGETRAAAEFGIGQLAEGLFIAPHLDSFARADGFSCWEGMKNFWFARNPRVQQRDIFVGTLLAWERPN